ncbi:MAG: phenylalanine--tRNA ligase subunit beta [Bacilli bacterium]|jgi:phenylalanyl-tRNA synthetase beta chain|nr:phenylalanine--tRNA ligase subunit beta [Bacilli bacterium]
MNVSYKLLNKYVELNNIDPYELGDILTNAGLEVESVRPLAQGSDLVIGYVEESYPHPNSDHLTVCITNVKSETLQICCGAPNVGQGQYVIVAKPGCKLDYAKVPVIKKVMLGGVESNGMICSLTEIGIPTKYQTKEQMDGIEVLEGDFQIGDEALTTLGYDDYILDLSLTPNRSDIYSIYALAIEVAGLLNTKLKDVNMSVVNDNKSKYKVNIEHKDCLSYGLFEFNDLVSQDSSFKTKNILFALGFKPRFNIVDDGNLAMVISGNPVHTFDADKLKSDTFSIRKGIEKDDFIALDDNKYHIMKDDLVIMNGDEIVAIAGVIGSKSSCIDENTKNIVVESAVFSHVSIRNTARRLDLFSEASTRYSKIVNKYTTEFPIALLEEYLGKKHDGSIEVNYENYQPLAVKVSHQKIEKVLGMKIAFEECVDILKRLSFKVEVLDNELIAYPPSYRKDIELDVDLIEEIIRVHGYNDLPSTLPLQEIIYNPLTDMQLLIKNTKNILSNSGLNEIITYQLSNKDKLDYFSTNKVYKELINPLNNERMLYRDNLLANMLETIDFNKSYQIKDQCLFEISNVFIDNEEKTYLSIGLMGNYINGNWHNQVLTSDFYVLKSIIFDYLAKLGFYYGRLLIEEVEIDHSFIHPTKSAYICMNKQRIGIFGAIHPRIASDYKLKNVYVAQIDLSYLAKQKGRVNKYEGISLIPNIYRDLSLVVPNDIKANTILKTVKQSNSKLINEINIFDIYHGNELEEDTYSMAISVEIGDGKKTLNEDEINDVVNNILKDLNKKLNITLRG